MIFTVTLRLIILLTNVVNYKLRLSNVSKFCTYFTEYALLLFNNSGLLMVFNPLNPE